MAADDHGLRPLARQRDPVIAGSVGLHIQTVGCQCLTKPPASIAPHRSPRDALRAVRVAGPRGQRAEIGNYIACAHISLAWAIIAAVLAKALGVRLWAL